MADSKEASGDTAPRVSNVGKLAGFYFVMSGHWERLAMALMGFIFMKVILTHKLGINKAI
jgi:hypothetical protein